MDILEMFEDLFDYSEVETSVSMKEHTSFKVGGNADVFITVNTPMELALTIKVLKEAQMDYIIIGKGSNLLVTDKGIRGAVIKFGERMSGVYRFDEEDDSIYADAGASLSSIAAFAAENSLTGFEFASGIPGSFGGGIFMNAGAYDGEMKDVLESVYVMDSAGELKTLPAEELGLSYRKSLVEEKGLIILGGTIRLKKGNKDDIKSLMDDLNRRRRDKQPLNYPSAGSTF
ncbi:MAG: FAD-binding protein, partial [Lachnospiraceae bacterium]|nr:FAD-binding protein [Lachnospiraceae bacterium]